LRILHVTPHLPPDQAANALLPWQLGTWMRERGDTIEYVAHPPVASQIAWRSGVVAALPGPVTWVPRRKRGALSRALRIGAVASSTWRIRRALAPAIARADVVHAHSNGLLAEIAVVLARRRRRPVVLTMYGTEIWHYRPKRIGPDVFTRAYHAASAVTFYSERLSGRARELGLSRPEMHTIYPPVPGQFTWHDERKQAAARAALGISNRHLLLNVKRLHPLADQRSLIEAMNEVIRAHPDTRLVLCGTGPLLEDLRTTARAAGVERHVTFAGSIDNAVIGGYYAAADLFILPSLLEALPTVAVEALACGTPVLSTDNPGGLELNGLFGQDVAIVPREQPLAIARAIARFLEHKRRALPATRNIVDRSFGAANIAAKYLDIYKRAIAGGPA
jgi:glycosyltransferase involved in cell wall biosynthesis